ncbi:MAG: ABC transporter ATP-binding protein [Candidatus Bathyarchaeia archaeon]
MSDSHSRDGEIMLAENITGYYVMENNIIHAVENCSLKLRSGDIVGIVGESGCGKSTFGKLLLGYDKPPLKLISGKVLVDGLDIYSMNFKQRARKVWGIKISRIPQYSMNSLNPVLKIKTIIKDYVKSKFPRIPERKILEMARNRLEELGLNTDVLEQYPFELSGGMKQRVVIIISTLLNPKVVIADEPTTALDVSTQRRLIEFMYNLVRKNIISSMIFISHDIAVLNQLCNYFYIMYAGEMVEFGKREDIINNPLHPYTQLLITTIPDINPAIKRDRLKDIPGFPPDLSAPLKMCSFMTRCPYVEDRCKTKPPVIELKGGRFVRCHLFGK